MKDKRLHKVIPCTGKLMTAEPATIGENFRTLKNLRPANGRKRGVRGMTKINSSVMDATYLKTRSAFHFEKTQPAESHVLVQAYNTGLTASQILDNQTAIPSAGNFSATELHTDSSNAGVGRFSNAPDGQMIYCNGIDSYIWGGDEIGVGAFITSTAAITDTGTATNPKDFTDEVNNTKTDSDNIAIIGGGLDSYTELLLHLDGADGSTTFTDAVGTHTPGVDGTDAQIDVTQSKFGTGALLLAGDDYLLIPDHADFNFSTTAVTIECWVRFSSTTGQHCFYSQSAGTDFVAFWQDQDLDLINFSVMSGGVRLTHQTATWNPSVNTWYHVALIRGWGGGANSWAITVDGTAIHTFTASITMPNIAGNVYIGSMSTTVFIDKGETGHPITMVNEAALSATAKWGDGSIYTDGVNDAVSIADHADWDIATNFTIGLWVKHVDHAGGETYISQYEGAGDWWSLYHTHGSGLQFKIQSGAADIVDTGAGGEITDTDWHYVTLCKVGDDYGVYLDGTQVAHTNDADTDTFSGPLYLGYGAQGYYSGYEDDVFITHTNYFSAAPDAGLTNTITVPTAPIAESSDNKLLLHANILSMSGHLDEYRVSTSARWTATFTPPERPYTTAARSWLIGSPRPLKGVKYTVSLSNADASTMSGSYWNGTTWQTLTLTDNTDTGASLAITGTVTFSSTVTTAKPKYLEGYFLYWYQFSIDAGEAEISNVTMDAPFQQVIDMWDGVFREAVRFYKYTTSYLDNTINVKEDDYDATASYTYSDLSSMGAFSDPNNALEIGFEEKITGLKIDVAPDYINSTADTAMSVDYWDGTDYVEVGVVTDGTSEGDISVAKSGVVTWNNNSLSNETKKVVSNSPPLYYYRVRFDKAMDASVRVNYVGGITAQKELSYHKFPIFAQGRILLCADMSEKKNKATCSGKYMPQVYNGDDSVDLYFGEQGELTCGVELFSQFGSNLYSLILMFKDTEMWITAGQDISAWENNTFLLSSSVGCPAPLTLKTVNLSVEPGKGLNRALAIWQGSNGIYMSDGRAPIPIHGDIKEYFDRSDSRCIKSSMVGDSVGFIDAVNNEYHWLFASGTSATTLNKELVYDIETNQWFEIDRGAYLQCGVEVRDTDGNNYAYGFLDTGYMERLEYGTDFDGTDITHTMHHGDFPLDDLAHATSISRIKLLTVAKTTTANNITCTHYGDTQTTGTEISMSPTKSGSLIAQPESNNDYDGDPFHSLKYEMVTDDETIGFEPLATVLTYSHTRED